jgi:hypothetical protein
MKRKPRFFIGFLAAAITFGTLMATIGPRHYRHHSHHCNNKHYEQNPQQEQDYKVDKQEIKH